MVASDPKNSHFQRSLSFQYNRLGLAAYKMIQPKAAMEYYEKGWDISKQLAKANPMDARAQYDLAVSNERLGDVKSQMEELQAALGFYEESSRIFKQLTVQDPKDRNLKRSLSLSLNRVADTFNGLRQPQKAMEQYKEGLEGLIVLAESDTKNAQAQLDLIDIYTKIGYTEQMRFDYSAAAVWYEKGLAIAKRFDRAEVFNNEIALLNRRIFRCQNTPKALSDLDSVLKQPAAEVPGLLDIRVEVFIAKNDLRNLVATADAYVKLAEKDDKQIYNAACAWSLASNLTKDDAKLKEEYAGNAMALLRKTPTGKGHFVDSPAKLAAHMKQDKDMDPLRDREDFKKFIAELEKR